MAGVFSRYRSQHHADADHTLDLTIALLQGRLDHGRAVAELRKRDRRLWLEMESSSMLGILAGPLVEACPNKRFILTIRDVFSWFESWADHHINRPAGPASKFALLDRVRLRPGSFPPTKHDQPLTRIGMESLSSYFALWDRHNSHVLQTILPHHLLVIKTDEILGRLADLASFTGVSEELLRPEMGWQNAAPVRHKVLSLLDPSYVKSMAEEYCGDLLRSRFPDAYSRF